ncbi:MAG: hypothetical protein CO113_18265 [Elusimicrobia bacterium CG_4_9_14_3_um_filter_62_55]|nr:MAG: hypothetical protein COR54_04280 [Elusimicrobia bacterium CG22_combo_CG10-13_8_21_14_all_63_91]PJA18642.1 MAG: hypothetical protein COX66_00550 [Elusimicrobia bacterium CG_4_10_14_0_2_um_filter_63_34]PJB23386.1 MAG: hypothetical protein CO113_18265 [Elusimicrobia bacterium CG_4_9_14_3_um_filter_62_55]
MARKPRWDAPGTIHHVMARGNDGQPIFLDDADRWLFLKIYGEVAGRFNFEGASLCLMGNHFHLLLRLGEVSMARIMRVLLSRYSKAFNKKYGRRGHLFQDRYKSILCGGDDYFMELLRYNDLNPLRAGLVEDPADWPWSSHGVYLGRRVIAGINPKFGLSFFGKTPAAARDAYRRYVLAGIKNPEIVVDPFKAEDTADEPDEVKQARVIAEAGPRLRVREPLEERALRFSRRYGVGVKDLRGRGKNRFLSSVRRRFVLEALNDGERTVDLARYLNRCHSAIVKMGQVALRELGEAEGGIFQAADGGCDSPTPPARPS